MPNHEYNYRQHFRSVTTQVEEEDVTLISWFRGLRLHRLVAPQGTYCPVISLTREAGETCINMSVAMAVRMFRLPYHAPEEDRLLHCSTLIVTSPPLRRRDIHGAWVSAAPMSAERVDWSACSRQ